MRYLKIYFFLFKKNIKYRFKILRITIHLTLIFQFDFDFDPLYVIIMLLN